MVGALMTGCGKKAGESNAPGASAEIDILKGGDVMTAEALNSLKRISEPQVSPDGKWVLFRMGTPSIKDNKIDYDLWVVSIDGKEMKQVTHDEASESNGIWSPDGKKIAYVSAKEGTPQIYAMEFPSLNSKKITSAENGVSNVSWSPDGKFFSYTSDVKLKKTPQENYPECSKAKVRIYKELPARHWNEWTDESYSHLFVVPAAGGDARDLMKDELVDTPLKPFGGVEEIAWSPDGSEIAYTAKKEPNFVEHTNSDIFIVNLKDGSTRNITKGMPGYDKAPLYSPDGSWIAFFSQERAGFESDKIRVMLFNRKSSEIFELTKTLDQWAEEKVWSPDSRSLVLSVTDSGCVQLVNITVPDGSWKKISSGDYDWGSGLCMTKDGKIVTSRQSINEPIDIFAMNSDGSNLQRLTNVNKDLLARIKPVKTESRWFTSTDKAKVQAWIIYPPNFDPNKKYPSITYCQGGPQSMISQQFHYRWNYRLLASQGYIVIAPNRRGVPGFGQKWNDAISRDWGGMPMQDILACSDIMAKEPYVDPDGRCAMGASAGGYATFWLAGNHNGRFKAFVAHCGVFNMESMYGSTEELWFPNWENGGPYWDSKVKPYYDKNSPHRFAQNWNTPILISTGENDFRVPYTQSLEAFTVAQSKRIPSELIVFPDECHFISHIQEFILWNNEVFKFLDTYCKKK